MLKDLNIKLLLLGGAKMAIKMQMPTNITSE